MVCLDDFQHLHVVCEAVPFKMRRVWQAYHVSMLAIISPSQSNPKTLLEGRDRVEEAHRERASDDTNQDCLPPT